MVCKTEGATGKAALGNATKIAILETGAKIEVPPFIEIGDIIKVDTMTDEYIDGFKTSGGSCGIKTD